MNVIEKLCEKYTTEFNLMFDMRVRPLALSFGPGMTAEQRAKVEAGLFKMSVFRGDGGLPVCLDMTAEGQCTLSVSGEERFRFAPRTEGIAFPNYDMTDAVLWALYIIATGKNWLDDYRGMVISCRCFSARQQAAAARINKSVTAQYDTAVPDTVTTPFYEKWEKYIAEVARRAPRFSARPIPAAVWNGFKGKPRSAHLGKLAEELFGSRPFMAELEQYLLGIKSGPVYKGWLEEARRDLADIVYKLPIMAINNLFTAVGTYIDTIKTVSPEEIASMLNRQEMFSLTPAGLQDCFGDVDSTWCSYVEATLRREFFRTVCDMVRRTINSELIEAQQNIYYLSSGLYSFCFTEADCFGTGEKINSTLSWKQLSRLQDSDVYSEDVSWETGALHNLQSRIKSVYAPQLWLCSDPLKNRADADMITDAHITRSVPVTDEKLVWAIWADVEVR